MADAPKPEQALALREGVAEALARTRAETLADLYDGWRGLVLARAAAAAERAREAERLDVRGQLLLGSVEAARELTRAPATAPAKAKKGRGRGRKAAAKALAPADPLGGFIAQSQQELAAARAALEARAQDEERFFAAEIERTKAAIQARAEAQLALAPPRVEAQVQPVGRDRSLVHLARLEPDALVLLAYVLSGKLFTRYGAFFDDSVDEVGGEPPRFFADDGNARTRFDDVEDEEALFQAPDRVFVPAKGFFAVRVPGHAFPRFRAVNRGPVIEVEARAEGGAYEHLMPRASAELFSGLLIKLKLERRIELSLRVA